MTNTNSLTLEQKKEIIQDALNICNKDLTNYNIHEYASILNDKDFENISKLKSLVEKGGAISYFVCGLRNLADKIILANNFKIYAKQLEIDENYSKLGIRLILNNLNYRTKFKELINTTTIKDNTEKQRKIYEGVYKFFKNIKLLQQQNPQPQQNQYTSSNKVYINQNKGRGIE